MRAIKKDRFWKDRGKAHIVIQITCSECSEQIAIYQKDGKNPLYRMYLNRILSPENLANLQDSVLNLKQMETLICSCGRAIGIPVLHWEGRLAFRLVPGAYKVTPLSSKD